MSKQIIEGNRKDMFLRDPATLVIIEDPDHPLYDERVKMPLRESLVRNIMTYGVKEPILVRKNGEAVEVIDGRQRVRHALEANKRLESQGEPSVRIPCVVEGGDDRRLTGLMVTLNEQREQDTPLVRAAKMQRLSDMGYTTEEIADICNIVAPTVKAYLKLESCTTPVRKAVEEGRISATAAAKLADLAREEQLAGLESLLASGATTAIQAARVVKAKKSGKELKDISIAPSKRVLRALLKQLEEDGEDGEPIEVDAAALLAWILGDRATAPVAIRTALRTAESGE